MKKPNSLIQYDRGKLYKLEIEKLIDKHTEISKWDVFIVEFPNFLKTSEV